MIISFVSVNETDGSKAAYFQKKNRNMIYDIQRDKKNIEK